MSGIENYNLPKISCLTITLNRLSLLKRAITCFCDQTYPSKELVIVTDGDEKYKQQISYFTEGLNRSDITLVFLAKKGLTLGALRNVSIQSATGKYVCQWDDDDLNHPDRLRIQFDFMMRHDAKACFLTDQFHFFENDKELFWVDWATGNDIDIIPGTLMMEKNLRFKYPEEGKFSKMGEDTIFLLRLLNRVKVAKLSNCGFLNVYVFHGQNTYSKKHHKEILNTFRLRDVDFLTENTAIQALDYFMLENVKHLNVHDRRVNLKNKIL